MSAGAKPGMDVGGFADVLLQPSPYQTDEGALIGRDPWDITAEEFEAAGIERVVGLRAIRAKCLDCCAGNTAEVRKCTATGCPLWPLRMGRLPPAWVSEGRRRVSPCISAGTSATPQE